MTDTTKAPKKDKMILYYTNENGEFCEQQIKFRERITGKLKEELDMILQSIPVDDFEKKLYEFFAKRPNETADDSKEPKNNADLIKELDEAGISLIDFVKHSNGTYVSSNQSEIDEKWYEYFSKIVVPTTKNEYIDEALSEFDVEFWKEQDYSMIIDGVRRFRKSHSI